MRKDRECVRKPALLDSLVGFASRKGRTCVGRQLIDVLDTHVSPCNFDFLLFDHVL